MHVSVATIAINRAQLPDNRANQHPHPLRLTISPEDGTAGPVYIPYSPTETDHTNIGADYARVARAGRVDALVYLKEQLPVMTFSLFISDKLLRQVAASGFQIKQSAMATIQTLIHYAKTGTRLKVAYGSLESGVWRITSISLTSARRDDRTNEITQADMELEFTKVSDIVVGIGPVTGGVQPPPATTPPATHPTRTYIVKKGDTLYGISIKYYGTGVHWKRIADANKIKDPRKLQIGTRLRIP